MARAPVARRRVVVTGIDCVSPLGADADASWTGAVAGTNTVAPIRCIDATEVPFGIAAECIEDPLRVGISPREIRRFDRVARLALAADAEAVGDAPLERGQADVATAGGAEAPLSIRRRSDRGGGDPRRFRRSSRLATRFGHEGDDGPPAGAAGAVDAIRCMRALERGWPSRTPSVSVGSAALVLARWEDG